MHTNIRRLAVTAATLLLVVAIAGCRYSGFVDGNAKTASAGGATYLKSQQLADGSFEVAGFPGFETPDAVLAIADNAQAQMGWSFAQAKAAVDATTNSGHSALHALDDFADSGINAGQAAKLAILVARPLGISTTSFDPDGDGAVNLQAIVDAGHQPDGSYGAFNATLYAAIAKRAFGGVPADTLAYIRAAQEAGGGWNFAGDPTAVQAQADTDTTALAIQALASAQVAGTDVDLREGVAFLARSQQANGAWQSFGADDPNSTAVAMIAITAAGFDPTVSCWRDVTAPALHGTAYTSPVTWLRGDQLPSGRFASPNDQFGVNTFATSQAVQALRRGWLPVEYLKVQTCP
ncbi:MAG: prenyltransferase/squalene oxidase repeat-containing protein [Acidimicrobiia bacterium]